MVMQIAQKYPRHPNTIFAALSVQLVKTGKLWQSLALARPTALPGFALKLSGMIWHHAAHSPIFSPFAGTGIGSYHN